MNEPHGVVIADQDTEELRTDQSTFRVWDEREKCYRELRLRVGRGVIKDFKPRERP